MLHRIICGGVTEKKPGRSLRMLVQVSRDAREMVELEMTSHFSGVVLGGSMWMTSWEWGQREGRTEGLRWNLTEQLHLKGWKKIRWPRSFFGTADKEYFKDDGSWSQAWKSGELRIMRLGWPYPQSSSWKVSSAKSQPAGVTAVEKGEAVGFVVFFMLPEMWRRDSGQSFGKGLKGEGRFCLSMSQCFASDFLTCCFFLPSFQNSSIRPQIIKRKTPHLANFILWGLVALL